MTRRRKDNENLNVTGIFQQSLRQAITRPTVNNYVPHHKQLSFHKGTQQQKLYIGGNRSGKTVGGTVEDVYWLRGKHPHRALPLAPGEACRGRIVCPSFTEGVKGVIIPELKKWIVPSDLINGSWEDSYNGNDRLLTFDNGAFVELMSYDQAVQKFSGTSRHFIHFDEEPPKAIFNECKMRLLDTGGSWWITMTPVDGMTWIYKDVYKGHLENLLIIQIAIEENPYVSAKEKEVALSGLDENERKARELGEFVQFTGRVYSSFDPVEHVIRRTLTNQEIGNMTRWTQYVSMDHGLSNPSAWLWHAVSPKGTVITYDELYDNEKLVDEYAREIHRRNGQLGRRPPDIYVGDPAIKQRNAETGHSIQTAYALRGIPIVPGNNEVRIGVNQVNSYLRANRWFITENCHNLISELQTVRWKDYETAKKRYDNNAREEIHKKDDHAPDSARYFFSMMPSLILPEKTSPEETANKAVQAALSAIKIPVGPHYIDEKLMSDLKSANINRTEWVVQDDYMGGVY